MSSSRTVMTVVGARPQFVKASCVSPALRARGLTETIVHTGQHYDWAMSEAFFQGLEIPRPDVNLQIGSATHGAQTGRMLEAIEAVLSDARPAMVVVFGDTNSTLAGALAAAKLMIPVAHVEGGLRSFNRSMPEETNRILTDHLSTVVFAPTAAAVANLKSEGITRNVVRTGDVMLDVVEHYRNAIKEEVEQTCRRLRLTPHGYAFATVHRPENTDDPTRWASILSAFGEIGHEMPIVWAAHPRTKELVRGLDLPGVRVTDPLPYVQTQALVSAAQVVLTDSGGLQKEAAFHSVCCVTLRDQTEWVELIEIGVNVLAGANTESIIAAARNATWPASGLPRNLYGDGQAGAHIAAAIVAAIEG